MKSDEDNSSWPRRKLVFAAIAASIVYACKTRRIRPTIAEAGLTGNDGEEPSNFFNYNLLEDLQEMPDASESKVLKTEICCYGSISRAIVALNLPDYVATGTLDKIAVFRSNGDPIAEKKITSVDADRLQNLRPVVFENLNLKSSDPLFIVYTMKDASKTRYKWVSPGVKMIDKYKNLPVEETNRSFAAHRPFLNFGISDPTRTHCGDLQLENGLQTFQCDDAAQVLPASGLKGYEICDIMNKPIPDPTTKSAVLGENFVSIVDYPIFICYKLEKSIYYRSIIRLF